RARGLPPRPRRRVVAIGRGSLRRRCAARIRAPPNHPTCRACRAAKARSGDYRSSGGTRGARAKCPMIDLYLMSPPGAGWSLRGRANFRSREAAAVDARAARREWLNLAEAIEARGGTVVALASPSAELTGMPYAAECGHVVASCRDAPPKFLLPRMA